MEALRNDGKKTRFHPFRRNAADAMSFFLKRGSSAWEPLLLALDSSDLQQRFLAAVALVYIDSQSAPALRIVPILVRQLRDNHIRNDAVLAAGSLYRMGRRVIPQLERSLRDADLQARTTLELVLLNLREPPRTASELARRRSMQRICHADPCYLMQRPGALVRYVAAFEDF